MCEQRKYGAINNHARGGNNKVKVTDDVREQIEVAVEQHPDATLKEIKQKKRYKKITCCGFRSTYAYLTLNKILKYFGFFEFYIKSIS